MPRSKEQHGDVKQGSSRRVNVFHDSTNTKKTLASEPFPKKEEPCINSAAPPPQQLYKQHGRQQMTQGRVEKGYPGSATPKVDNRNKYKVKQKDDSNVFDDNDARLQLATSKSHLFTEHNINDKKSVQKNSETNACLNNNVSTLLQSDNDRGKSKTSELEVIQRRPNSQKRTDTTATKPSHKKRQRKETPSTVEGNIDAINVEVNHSRTEVHVSNKKIVDPRREDKLSFEKILTGPNHRAPNDILGRPIVTKEALKRAFHSQVDNAPVLKAMLESCRHVEDSERVHRMYNDGEDQKSVNLVSLSTAFGVRMIDTSKSCSASVDGSDLTLLSSDEDYEEILELPPGWKEVMSRSKNKPYYVHPDHGRTWYCPALIRRRKRRKAMSSVAPVASSKMEKIHVSAHEEKNHPNITVSVLNEGRNQDFMYESMDESNSYEQIVQGSSSDMQEFMVDSTSYEEEDGSKCPRMNPSKKELNPFSHQMTSNDELSSVTESTSAKCNKANILSMNEVYSEQSQEDLSPTLHSCFHHQKDERNSYARNALELYNNPGVNVDNLDDVSSSFIQNTEQFSTSKTSNDFDDIDFNEGGDIPMAGYNISPNRFQAENDSNLLLDRSEEGRFDDQSFEMFDDESSRWILYPHIPRCSLQYLHKILHA